MGSVRPSRSLERRGARARIPIYTTIAYPWHVATPPFIPRDFNPVSSYRRTFTVPNSWAGKEVFVTFNGVSSFFTVWLNDRELGFNKDAATSSTC